MNNDSPMVEPGRPEAPAGAIRFLRMPQRDLFATRAARFAALAGGHPLAEYLSFLASLASAQQYALEQLPSFALPGPKERALCREQGVPLLAARKLARDPAWLEGLAAILRQTNEAELPAAARGTIADLIHADSTALEDTAGRILAGDLAGIPSGELPFVSAALQVYWLRMASVLGEEAFGRLNETGICPVCGSFPVAGIIQGGGNERGLRYLCCSLCASQWHLERIKCSACASTQGIDYFALEGSDGSCKAESCNNCGTYLKLFYLEKENGTEAMVDDLATVSLDVLMAGEGRARKGLNLFFHPGAA